MAIRIVEKEETRMATVEVDDVRDVWIVWGNTDNTEGKGRVYIRDVCEIEATALRVGKGRYVMGRDCPISKATSYKINNTWVQPSLVTPPRGEDKVAQERIDAERSTKNKVEEAVLKAEKLGLSQDDLEVLRELI